jgi:sugar O-acyltransferase (sialic acid O-acetyltransferase NeuD family)
MKQIAIYGGGGFGREVMPIVKQQLIASCEPYQLAFVDDGQSVSEINGYKVLTYSEWLARPASSRHICIAVGSATHRQHLAERCSADTVNFFEVRSSNALVFDRVSMGEGVIICPFVTLTSNISIGKHFHANIYSYVAHDCKIGDYVTFAPGVMCNGNVIIDDHAYIGAGAVIKQGLPDKPLVIGRGAVIGMGAVVTKSVAPGVTVVGNPARPLTNT